MPAGSDPPPLPHTFRPIGVRVATYVFGVMLFVVAAVVWVAFPPEIRAKFTTFQRVTVIFFGVAMLVIGYALARSRVVTREDGVRVVNGYRTHRLDWNQIVAVSLRPGSPWAVLDLSDGTSVGAMGIQGSDGARALTQVRQLRQLVEQKTATERDD